MSAYGLVPPWLAVLLLGLVLIVVGALRASDTDEERERMDDERAHSSILAVLLVCLPGTVVGTVLIAGGLPPGIALAAGVPLTLAAVWVIEAVRKLATGTEARS